MQHDTHPASHGPLEIRDARPPGEPPAFAELVRRGHLALRAAVTGTRQVGLALTMLHPSGEVLAMRRAQGALLDPLRAGSALLAPLVVTAAPRLGEVVTLLVRDAERLARRAGRGALAVHARRDELWLIDAYLELRFELLRQVDGPDGPYVELGMLLRTRRRG